MLEIERFVTNHEPRTTNTSAGDRRARATGWVPFTLRHAQETAQSSGWARWKQQVGGVCSACWWWAGWPRAGAQLLLRRAGSERGVCARGPLLAIAGR